jgi:prepilin-type N-terminal cleavage/methylation domain-containing protein
MTKAGIQVRRRRRGFTLIELLVGMGVAAVISSACLVAFSAIQKCYQLSMARSGVRMNVVRVLDSVQMDLRNASAVTASVAGTYNVFPLTMTMPQRYTEYEPSGDLAGDPGRMASRLTPQYDRTTGKLAVARNITVTYTSRQDTATTLTVSRQVQWVGADGRAKSATRAVATLPKDTVIRFRNNTGGLLATTDKALIAQVSVPVTNRGRATAPIELQGTVYLRGKALP